MTWDHFLTINIKVYSQFKECFEYYSCKELNNRYCHCDDLCSLYGDCCHDAQQVNSTSNSSSNLYNMLSCIQTSFPDPMILDSPNLYINVIFDAYFMVATCPQQWVSSHPNKQMAQQILHYCTNSNLSPVTDQTTDFTFRNIYCAQCNNINQSQLVQWEVNYICDIFEIPESVSINNQSQIKRLCHILNFTAHTEARFCTNLISTCPNEVDKPSKTSELCETKGLTIVKKAFQTNALFKTYGVQNAMESSILNASMTYHVIIVVNLVLVYRHQVSEMEECEYY